MSNIVVDHAIQVYNRGTKQQETVTVSVIVDTAAVARAIGAKAWQSKAGRSRVLHGAIIVTHGPQK